MGTKKRAKRKGKKKPAQKWTSTELKARIGRRHPLSKGWFTVTEFCPASGSHSKVGRMDALSVALYGSRNFETHGFEVKISRGDWLSELRNPAKNSIGQDSVDYWWIVAPSTEIVKPDELPPKWGLFTCSGMGLRATIRASRLKEELTPFSRPFAISLLWKLSNFKMPDEEALAAARLEGYTNGQRDGKKYGSSDSLYDVDELERLRKTVRAFEDHSGVGVEWLDEEGVGKIGDIVKALRISEGQTYLRGGIQQAKRNTRALLKTLDDAEGQLDAVHTPIDVKAGLEGA